VIDIDGLILAGEQQGSGVLASQQQLNKIWLGSFNISFVQYSLGWALQQDT